MRYCFCTIAVGEKYFNQSIEFAKKLNENSNSHHYVVVTDQDQIEINNVTFYNIDPSITLFISGFFNYNLKYLPIRKSQELGFDYIFFVDADWRLLDSYSDQNILDLITNMEQNKLDFIFERPHLIGKGKYDNINCFWKHKVSFYNLLNTEDYDEGHVVNEQFLGFKNNEKLDIFLSKWEKLEKMATKSNLWSFAEGVEIGMSSCVARMNFDFIKWKHYVKDIFSFTTVDGKIYNKF
jgi:hypothetical protein